MSAIPTISPARLNRLLGTPDQPLIIDIRTAEDFAAAPALIPGAIRQSHDAVADWGPSLDPLRRAVVVCQRGRKLSQGVAAWLRHLGVAAETLEGGSEAWSADDLPTIPGERLPRRDPRGRTVWVTRARPKVDRIACPWLIRRFVDPSAVVLYVGSAEVIAVAEHFDATPFDVEGVALSHRDGRCTFDAMLDHFTLRHIEALDHLSRIVRGADTGALELAPQAPGLLAASLGLSRMYAGDLAQLDAGLVLYDAFYRWCRDATEETHDRDSHRSRHGSR